MFKFTMDAKDADCLDAKLAAADMEVHRDGRLAIDKVCFIVKDRSPKNLNEALKLIQEVFPFPPINVWLDGKKLDPFKAKNKIVKVGRISRLNGSRRK